MNSLCAASPIGDRSFLRSKKIVFLVNNDWFFLSHRLPLARAARDSGASVVIAGGDSGLGEFFRDEGFQFEPIHFSPSGTNALRETGTFRAVFSFLKKTKPHLLHTISTKPILYGSAVSRFFGSWPVVNAVCGLGYIFSPDRKASVLRKRLSLLYRAALGNPESVSIFQNPSDMEKMLSAGFLRPEQATLIRGAGVNCSVFSPTPFPEAPVVMFPSRMLWEKGVEEFVKAAHMVLPRFPGARFVLVGASEDDDPRAVSRRRIAGWLSSTPGLEWWGSQKYEAMPEILSRASIVALPSGYPEGLPKCLLEAAASGRPIIASDIPGCREIARHGVNAILVPPRDASRLAEAVMEILSRPALMEEFGREGRRIACSEFAEEMIVSQTMAVYRKALRCPGEQG